jgi:hypothetical protein
MSSLLAIGMKGADKATTAVAPTTKIRTRAVQAKVTEDRKKKNLVQQRQHVAWRDSQECSHRGASNTNIVPITSNDNHKKGELKLATTCRTALAVVNFLETDPPSNIATPGTAPAVVNLEKDPSNTATSGTAPAVVNLEKDPSNTERRIGVKYEILKGFGFKNYYPPPLPVEKVSDKRLCGADSSFLLCK